MDPSLNEISYIDSHAHINLLDASTEELGSLLSLKHIDWVLVPGFDLTSSKEAIALSQTHKWVLPTAGIHPHDAFPDWNASLSFLSDMADQKKIAGIGEIGLDGIRSKSLPEHQLTLFEEQMQIADRYALPVIVHNREKDHEVQLILNKYPAVNGILHCYSSDEELALQMLQKGWIISFSMNITYPKSNMLRELIRKIPLTSLLLETDSPYLPPLQDRGKRNNTPLNIPVLYQWVSDWLSVSVQDLCKQLKQNFIQLFSVYLEMSHGRT